MMSVETLRCDAIAPALGEPNRTVRIAGGSLIAGQGFPTLLVESDRDDARRPVEGVSPPPVMPVGEPRDSILVEGELHCALPPIVERFTPSRKPVVQSMDSVDRDSDSDRRRGDVQIDATCRCSSPCGSAPADLVTPSGGNADPWSAALSGGAQQFHSPAGQHGHRGDQPGLPSVSHARIAARKAGHAQRNADERPPAGGEPHRHR